MSKRVHDWQVTLKREDGLLYKVLCWNYFLITTREKYVLIFFLINDLFYDSLWPHDLGKKNSLFHVWFKIATDWLLITDFIHFTIVWPFYVTGLLSFSPESETFELIVLEMPYKWAATICVENYSYFNEY